MQDDLNELKRTLLDLHMKEMNLQNNILHMLKNIFEQERKIYFELKELRLKMTQKTSEGDINGNVGGNQSGAGSE